MDREGGREGLSVGGQNLSARMRALRNKRGRERGREGEGEGEGERVTVRERGKEGEIE